MAATREGTTRSGWCFGAPGARVPHRWCRSEICQCSCHKVEAIGIMARLERNEARR